MKSRILVLTMTGLLFVGTAPAMAADSSPVAPESSWTQLATKVKVTVAGWISYWNGTPVTTTPTTAAQVATPVAEPAKLAAPNVSVPAQAAAPTPAPEAAAPAKVTPPPAITSASKELRNQPLFESKGSGSTLEDVKQLHESLTHKSAVTIAKPGRAGTSKLAKSKAGVPVTNWAIFKKIKKIQRLDIGTENRVSSEDFKLAHLSWSLSKPSALKKLPQPQLVSEAEIKKLLTPTAKALSTRGLQANIRTVGQPITRESVEKIEFFSADPKKITELAYKPLSDEQLKMVAALILFDAGNHCPTIMGLFNQLASAPKTKIEATYHLGACAAQLKMHQSAFENLSKVVLSEDKDFAADAMSLMAKDLLVIYEKDFYALYKKLKNPKALITEKTRDEISYRLAKGAFRAADYKTSLAYASQVSESSEYSEDARFLSGMNSFALGDKASALKKLEELWAVVGKSGASNIRALTSVNLARMYFAANKYDKALEQYMQVPKDHPLWVQALIEQGWTQLAMEDYSGAIGNMYSLHSPYFKAVYQPESFVVRTIGYLNICQYGDAYKSLSYLEKDYRDWQTKTNSYLAQKGKPSDIYATVKNYIRGKSTDDVDGVPYQVWREMAHRKDFLNLQTALNDKQDESKRYAGVNEKIKAEKATIRVKADQAKKRFDQWKVQIAKASLNKTESKNLESMRTAQKLERDLTIAYRFQLAILEQSREGYLDFQKAAQLNLDNENVALGGRAGEMLLTHATNMQKEMSRVLDNNEFLRYEVFSGSGENIRYQVAGGKVSGANRIPASIKPSKMMNWSFDGEFWEDEIGSYRSSLQNNCPITNQARKAEQIPADQARHVDDDEN